MLKGSVVMLAPVVLRPASPENVLPFLVLLIIVASPLALGQVPKSTEPDEKQSQAAGVFLAALRTQNHIARSSSEKFAEAVDGVQEFLTSNNVLLREDPVRGKFRLEGMMSKENEIRIAEDAGATHLLQLVVDRPATVWMELTMQCFDLQGKLLWEERASASNQLTSSGHVQKAVKKLTSKLAPKLGSDCLPVSAAPKLNATQDKEKK